jgi:hypothetical protein
VGAPNTRSPSQYHLPVPRLECLLPVTERTRSRGKSQSGSIPHVGQRDFNGDGKGDIGTGDFNGDGKSDILWRDASGNVAIWLMNGAQVTQAAGVGAAPTVWSIVETGDFNGDGKSDLVWHDTSGNVAIWFMNGTQVAQAAGAGNAPTVWSIQGVNAD